MTIYKTTMKISCLFSVFFLILLYSSKSNVSLQNVYISLFTGTIVILGVSTIHYWHERMEFFKKLYSELVQLFQNLNTVKKFTEKIRKKHTVNNVTIIMDKNPYFNRLEIENIVTMLSLGVEKKNKINIFQFDPFYKSSEIKTSFKQILFLTRMVDELKAFAQNINMICLEYAQLCIQYDIALKGYKSCSMTNHCHGYEQCYQNNRNEKKRIYCLTQGKVIRQIKEVDIHLEITLIKLEEQIRLFDQKAKGKTPWQELKPFIIEETEKNVL